MKKLIAIVLSLVMTLLLCACGSNENDTIATDDAGAAATGDATTVGVPNAATGTGEDSGAAIDAGAMVLTEMGTVPDGVSFTTGGIITKSEGEKVQVLNQNGVSFNDIWYDDVDSIVSNGICIVANTDADGKELLGVVDSLAEKELLPCEAIEIRKLSDRFLIVGYMTGEGSEDESFGIYFVGTELLYYKGYGKILDLQTGQIVPNIEITTSKNDASATGNVIFVDKDYRTTDVYTAEGKLAGTYEYIYAYPESGIAIQRTAEAVCIYDKDMKLVSTLPRENSDDYDPVEGSSEILLHKYEVAEGSALVSRYRITDLKGNALSAEYARIEGVIAEDYLRIMENNISSLVDFEGNTILSGYYAVYYVAPGYFIVNIQGEGYYLYDTTGKKLSETAFKENSDLLLKDDEGNVFVYETGEMIEKEGYPRAQTGSLVLIGTDLYDVISGKIVFENVEGCVSTGGNLYVWDSENEQYTRYVAEFK